MDSMTAQQVMSGTHGEIWIDGDYMAEVTEFKAEVTLEKIEVNIVKKQGKHYKVTGFEGKGSVKFNKVSSYMQKKTSDSIKAGKQVVCTIISKISDPDAIGAERVVVRDAVFDKLILADWAAKKMGEESYDFTFSDWEFLDLATE